MNLERNTPAVTAGVQADRVPAAGRAPQVIVAGAGPAGLVAAITLAGYGVRVLVVEKRTEISGLSRALGISTRSMEILRSWGLEDQVRAGASDVEPCGWVTPTLASGEGTVIPLGHPSAAEAAKVSPTRPAWAPQNHLEPILVARLRDSPVAEVRFGCELTALKQDDRGVAAVLHDRGTGATYQARARYLIGADGAHSTVRDQLGISMEGPDALAEYHRVEFRAPLAAIAGNRRYGINVITRPGAVGVLAPRGRDDRWGLSREWTPRQPALATQSPEQLAGLIAAAAGVAGLRPRIERVSTFSFAAQIASCYGERRGFVLGDAAHRMTPRGGTGMNTAIHDAYDLGWKLAWVLKYWAEPSLLDTYQAERRPVGLHNVTRSADPNGLSQTAEQALPWDLNGRIPHHWLRHRDRRISTLDLLGDGLTVITGAAEPGWDQVAAALHTRVPVAVRTVDQSTADRIGIQPGGAVLLRPDGQPLINWPKPARRLHSGALGDHLRRR
jgi:putative polyketide hydroxylase